MNIWGRENHFKNQFTDSLKKLSDTQVKQVFKLVSDVVEKAHNDPHFDNCLEIDVTAYPELEVKLICYTNGVGFSELKNALIYEMAMRWMLLS